MLCATKKVTRARQTSDERSSGMESECEGMECILRISSSDGSVHHVTKV
jgi:hypothetical protein